MRHLVLAILCLLGYVGARAQIRVDESTRFAAIDGFVIADVGVANDYEWSEEAIVKVELFREGHPVAVRYTNTYLKEGGVTRVRYEMEVPDGCDTACVTLRSLIGEEYANERGAIAAHLQ